MILDQNNKDYIKAFEILNKTEYLKTHLFLTGVAGTGKSTFLKYVKSKMANMVILAPTGISAINVQGQTIHSFFRLPLRALMLKDRDITKFSKSSCTYNTIKALEILVIDEISMVRPDLIDAIDYSLRINGGDPDLPFGGKRLVFIGDMFQLEPVVIDSYDQNVIKSNYKNKYFYSAKVFEKLPLKLVEFRHNYRQSDPKFQSLLNKLRIDSISRYELETLNTRLTSEVELNKLNNIITLTTTNKMAKEVNRFRLAQLKSRSFNYKAVIKNEFGKSLFPTDEILSFKKGSQVMFIKNGGRDGPWVNGTIGTIHYLDKYCIEVKLEDGSIHEVKRVIWENIKYRYSEIDKCLEEEIIGMFKQYPLKLAWAFTIHKSQGLSYDRAIIDFGDGAFANGQVYVALSRLRTFNGLFLKRPIKKNDIRIDFEIFRFYNTLNSNAKY